MDTTGVTIELGDAALEGDVALPDEPAGMVLFAHGSGSSRHSPRNRAVAAGLHGAGFGTLLVDLLTEGEERRDAGLRFDIGLLTRRLVGAVDRLKEGLESAPHTSGLPIGLFGASTGAAGALAAAAERPGEITAVVSRGGRPDLAGPALELVRAPVRLIVGGGDPQVLELNRQAGQRLAAVHDLQVVPGASHLFEEPGALEKVTALAADWFLRHLSH
ncbi:dienelactone hydrolase family protein [Actinomadura macrotermitis]|uniref:Putative phosphoribosyl transferase n=1 Tax=Actinomadura macrotermitis TaxID=2585200 RepID=A0A7K0BVQ4_9ACTN|nr:dienelactone hydrolase family protein [Actinomadura macrotermitis]MQY04764.1 putative phosphoribosyl transferase [Actinomadura macrotermitis]